MSAPQPIAVFGDTVMIVTALMAGRYLLVAVRGEARWAGVAARWMRRIAIVAVILLLLRLASIGVMRPEIAGPIAWLSLAILAAGAAILMVDHILMDAIRPWVKRRRGRP
jgi:hypothetical protein